MTVIFAEAAMTLNQIIYFARTAEYMNMARAAKVLMIAQPSLSMSLSKLEDELGVALFEKKGRGITLTPEGQRFLLHAQRIINDVNSAVQEMQCLKNEAESSLTIGYINPVADHFLPSLFRNFRASSPEAEKIHLKSVEMDTVEIVEALANNTVDLTLSSRITGHEELTQIPILRQPLVLIVPKGHWLEKRYRAQGTPLNCEELAEEPLVIYFTRSPMHKQILDYFQEQGVKPNVCHYAYNEAAIANLVAEGMGIAIVARVANLPWDRVTELPLDGLTRSRNIYLTYRTNRKMFAAARQMAGFIRQNYGLE
jgi:DNA-binding transcriptional LysR family regulator